MLLNSFTHQRNSNTTEKLSPPSTRKQLKYTLIETNLHHYKKSEENPKISPKNKNLNETVHDEGYATTKSGGSEHGKTHILQRSHVLRHIASSLLPRIKTATAVTCNTCSLAALTIYCVIHAIMVDIRGNHGIQHARPSPQSHCNYQHLR